MTLRKVTPLPFPNIVVPDLGRRPEVRWVAPTSLLIDGTYQRSLSKASIAMMNRMIERFAWNRMKVPNVVEVDQGLHLIDGQHTAIVAATLRVPEIPVYVVEGNGVVDRAQAFVGLNVDRIAVGPFGIYKALLASGDPEAVELDKVCRLSKVRLRQLNQSMVAAEGDTQAIGVIKGVLKRQGAQGTRAILDVLIKAKCIPILASQIQATEQVMFVLFPGVDPERLARIIRIDGEVGMMSAQSHAKVGRIPVWKALIERWKMKGLSRAAA